MWRTDSRPMTMVARKITRNSASQVGRDETVTAYSFPRWVSHLNSPTDLTKSLQLLPRPSVLFVSRGIKARHPDARISRNFLPENKILLIPRGDGQVLLLTVDVVIRFFDFDYIIVTYYHRARSLIMRQLTR